MARRPADSSVFHAIADPTRRAILDALRDGEQSVSALMAAVPLLRPAHAKPARRMRSARSPIPPANPGKHRPRPRASAAESQTLGQSIGQSAFSQHLAVLRRAGLVTSRQSGRARLYAFRPEPLRQIVDWIAEYDRFWTTKLDALGGYLDRTHPPPIGKTPKEELHR